MISSLVNISLADGLLHFVHEHKMECFSANKKNKIIIFVGKWKNLKNKILRRGDLYSER